MDDEHALKILKMSTDPLSSIDSFENFGVSALLPPFREDVLDSMFVKDLESLYSQLYPCQVITHVSPFYVRAGRALLCNQVIGSVMNSASCNSSSVIMAYWPTGGSISNVDYSRMRVGRVHYFCRHKVTLWPL